MKFLWMLPAVLGFTVVCATTLRVRGGSRTGLVPAEWLVGFVVLLNVSQIVRMQLVHDLINRRRVEDVKRQLDVPESERFTIEGIGVSAGFGSRSALYSAFKRYEGMTPTAYRYSSRKASAG